MAAILSGNLDSSFIELPSVIISSSHSTDETIVADSDVEMDTGISTHAAVGIKSETTEKSESRNHAPEKYEEKHVENSDADEIVNCSIAAEPEASMLITEEAILIKKIDKNDTFNADKHENSDILYSQDLVVRHMDTSSQPKSNTASSVNFKRFRKKETVSGNSFRNLIPFSKDPYKEADYGRDESEYMKDERKRKKLEAIAEEMFNSEKPKKRAAAGASLEAFLARR